MASTTSQVPETGRMSELKDQYQALLSQTSNKPAPKVVGVYGIPGSGKSYLLKQLATSMGKAQYTYFEGSEVIASLVSGGLDAFRHLPDEEKLMWRKIVINTIKERCIEKGTMGVVAGHLSFWEEGREMGDEIVTPDDLNTYTHILYLEVDAERIAERRRDDASRARPTCSVVHLKAWQDAEIKRLRGLCCENGILFCRMPSAASQDAATQLGMPEKLLHDFLHRDEAVQLDSAEGELDEFVEASRQGPLKTMLVFDGDRTLAAEDSGEVFWSLPHLRLGEDEVSPLKHIFGKMGYTHAAFSQVALLYEETAKSMDFDALCDAVAASITVHPDLLVLLRMAANQKHVGVMVLTCGLGRVWEKVMEKLGLSGTVKVIGSGCFTDKYVVTPSLKAALVSRLRKHHHMYVLAFGDSPLDLPMLAEANHAIVVVGEEKKRSKTMDAELREAIEGGRLQANQLLLPSNVPPRLDVEKLPLIRANDIKFANFSRCGLRPSLGGIYQGSRLLHATDRGAAKLLMTPTRNAHVRGPELQEAHRRIGQYLATEFLPEMIGLEEYDTLHVQGYAAKGYRLDNQQRTLIIALMRGGEPMASGVFGVMPNATFFHADRFNYDQMLCQLLNVRDCVILVDSVVNSGKSILDFAVPIRQRCPKVQIVVVAGVVQDQCLSSGGLVDMLVNDEKFCIVALRISGNKFVGMGGTDTGNRLFNTL